MKAILYVYLEVRLDRKDRWHMLIVRLFGILDSFYVIPILEKIGPIVYYKQ